MEKVILASASPRRKELLATAGIDFQIIVADVCEKIPEGAKPYEAVMSLALQKACAVAENNCGRVVIGADTVVSLDGEILGKPKSVQNAKELLRKLSGRVHKVYTGVALVLGGVQKTFYEETSVEFYPLSDSEIEDYVKTGEPMDKAGAYGIQGRGCIFVRKIDGDYFNVMGLPVAKVYRELCNFNA